MNLTTYSAAFKEEAIRKALQRGTRTVADLARELNMSVHTLKGWIRGPNVAHLRSTLPDEKPASQWTTAQRLQALLDTHALGEEDRNAWCRQRGVFAHQLIAWRKELEDSGRPAVADARELRKLKEELVGVRRDLARKDKALSEAAALLVLQKKYQALWEDEDR